MMSIYRVILQNYPDTLIFGSQAGSAEFTHTTSTSAGETVERVEQVPAGTKLKRKVSSLFKKPQKSILKKTVTNSNSATATASTSAYDDIGSQHRRSSATVGLNLTATTDSSHSRTEETTTFLSHSRSSRTATNPTDHNSRAMSFHHLKVRRQSLTYRGAMLNITRYHLRASSCPDIYRNSMSTIALDDMDEYGEGGCAGFMARVRSCARSVARACCPSFGQRMLSAGLALFCLSNFILYAWYDVMYVYLVDYAEMDLKLSATDATLLLSVIGLFNTAGEV